MPTRSRAFLGCVNVGAAGRTLFRETCAIKNRFFRLETAQLKRALARLAKGDQFDGIWNTNWKLDLDNGRAGTSWSQGLPFLS